MKTLIVYDSLYGNTKKVAETVAEVLQGTALHVSQFHIKELEGVNLFIVGSPVHGGRATPVVDFLLQQLGKDALHGVYVTAFDTRFASEDHGFGLRLLMSIIRYAASRIAGVLVKKGGDLIMEPEGFIVEDKEGPLKEGEIERATAWAIDIKKLVGAHGSPLGCSAENDFCDEWRF